MLSGRNLNIDAAIKLLGIQDWQIEDQSNLEMMKTIMNAAAQQEGFVKEAELIKVILRETIKDYKPDNDEAKAEFNNKKHWV